MNGSVIIITINGVSAVELVHVLCMGLRTVQYITALNVICIYYRVHSLIF